jgi:hypothetical protein
MQQRTPAVRMIRWVITVLMVTATAAASLAEETGWKPLFDGKSLDGWIQRGGKASYSIEDDAIVGRTAPRTPNSFLCTEKDYSDFVLEFEVKVDRNLNSGVQIRSHSRPDYKDGRVHGYQVEIDPSARAVSGGIYDESGRGWLADLKDNERGRKAFNVDDWNRYRVEACGDTFRTFVNGVQTALLVDDVTSSGFIGLQVHATTSTLPLEVRWRNLRIRELDKPFESPTLGKPAPPGAHVLFDGSNLEHWEKPGGGAASWKLVDGAMEIVGRSGSIQTRKSFGDMRLHLEFRTPAMPGKAGQARANSGVYIQDRYEVQILDSHGVDPVTSGDCGAIYKVAAPRVNRSAPPEQWQTFDTDYKAPKFDGSGNKQASAKVTVLHNGVAIHQDAEISAPTGAALVKGEPKQPGPLVLQDHGDPVQFRNIWVEGSAD